MWRNASGRFDSRDPPLLPLNLGASRETIVVDLTRQVLDATGFNVDLGHGPPREGDIRRSAADARRAREVLGWEPETELGEGLERTVAWVRSAMVGRP